MSVAASQRLASVAALVLMASAGLACETGQREPPDHGSRSGEPVAGPGSAGEATARPDPFETLPAGWSALPAPRVARGGAAAVWTGGSLFYWGGEDGALLPRSDGAIYEARSRRWVEVPGGPLAARAWPAAVWTGEEVLVWGGTSGERALADGAAYDPESREWTRLPAAPLSPRVPVAGVWTGTEFLVWGDRSRFGERRDGAAYDPRTDRWRRIADAPFALNEATAVWTGRELIVVGALLDGNNAAPNPKARALAYDPNADRWQALRDQPLSPQASAVAWDGKRLVAWDYELRARTYDPRNGRWAWIPKLPLRFQECYPRSVAVNEAVLAWYCGQAALRLPASGPPSRSTLTSEAVWSRIEPPVSDLSAEPVAAGETALLIGSSIGKPVLLAYRPPDEPAPAKLVPLPPKRLAHCRRSQLLRPACPTIVPEVDGGRYLSHLSEGLLSPPNRMHVFNLEHGGEWPGKPEWNRPPAMAHVVLVGGEIGRISPSGDPACPRQEPLADGVMHRERTDVVCFGPLPVGIRRGDLFLAPSFPTGGMIGNHLVFRWRENGHRYALSLHGWEPLTEAAAVLEKMVAALE